MGGGIGRQFTQTLEWARGRRDDPQHPAAEREKAARIVSILEGFDLIEVEPGAMMVLPQLRADWAKAADVLDDANATPDARRAAERAMRQAHALARALLLARRKSRTPAEGPPPKAPPRRDLHREAERLARARGAPPPMDEAYSVPIFLLTMVAGESVGMFFGPSAAGVGTVTGLILAFCYWQHAKGQNERRAQMQAQALEDLELQSQSA